MLGRTKEVEDQAALSTGSTPVADSSTIGKGMTVTGKCETVGFLRVAGTVKGDAVSNGIEVTDSGSVDGDLLASSNARKMVAVVAGRVTGMVRASVVKVPQGGQVLGGIEADEVTIHGRVEGGLTVRGRLAIAATAVIDGDVSTRSLMMEEGGRVNGMIRMGDKAKSVETTPTKEDAAA